MSLKDDINNILREYNCDCYLFNEKDLFLSFNQEQKECKKVNELISFLTGFLLLNRISYTMTSSRDIIINI